MQFNIRLTESLEKSSVYDEYSRFIYRQIQKSIRRLVKLKSKNYDVRRPQILEILTSLSGRSVKDIDLEYYMLRCLDLVENNGVYQIKLNEDLRVRGTRVKVSVLVRLLEFGAPGFPELPVIRRVLSSYKKNYKYLYEEFMKEKFGL